MDHETLPRICEGDEGRKMNGYHDVAEVLVDMADAEVELFMALLLDGKNRIIRKVLVSVGSLTSSIVHTREVFCEAVRERAAALVVAHNHPSGDPSPSRDDIEVTARLFEAGKLIGIGLLDHVIIGKDGKGFSFKERGFLPE